MERITSLFYEAEMAMEKFGLTYDEWCKKPQKVRTFQLAVYRLSQAKKSYYNTPSDQRFAFFKGSK
jgi:hypothetical protein